MMKKVKNYLPYAIIVLAVTLPWILRSGYLFFTDFTWGPNVNLTWVNGWTLLKLMSGILSVVLSMDIIQKFFIIGSIVIVLLGGRKIAKLFISEKWGIFAVSLMALFNPFIYDRFMYGQVGIILAFGFLCLMVGSLFSYNGSNKKEFLLASIYAAFAIQFSQHTIFFIGLFYLIFFVSHILHNNKNYKKLCKLLFIAVAIVFILNANWITSTFLNYDSVGVSKLNIQRQDVVAFQTAGDTGWGALKNVVMMSGFWGKDQYRYIDLTKVPENWGRSFVLLLPLILLGIIINFKFQISNFKNSDKEKYRRDLTIGLCVLYIIAVILAVGIRLPICREITYWMFAHVPFYKGMRETQKWVAVIVIIYMIFLSIGINRLFNFKFIKDNKIAISILIMSVIIMQAPLILWGLGGQVRPTQYPADWYEIDEVIKSKVHKVESSNCDDQILFLPWHMYMRFDWIGDVVATPAQHFFSCPIIQGTNMEWGGIYNNSGDQRSKIIENWIFSKGQTNLINNDTMNIEYIILAKEVDWGKYRWLDDNHNFKTIKDTENLKLYAKE